MIRKRLIHTIGIFTIIVGLSQFWSFFSPFFDSSRPKVLNPILIAIGILFLLSGWGVFRLNAIGREFSFWLWFASLIGSLLTTAFLILSKNSLITATKILAIVLLSAWTVVNLLVVIFLGQRETKKLFESDTSGSFAKQESKH